DPAAFFLGILHSIENCQEPFGCVDSDEVDAEVRAEGALHLRPFVLPQQAVIHEDAGELISDGTMYECGSDGRVDTARPPADRTSAPFPLAYALHLLLDERAARPVGLRAT